MNNTDITQLRDELDKINLELLDLMNERGKLVKKIGEQKESMKEPNPVNESDMLNQIINHNKGPFEASTIEHLFKELFKADLDLLEGGDSKALLVSREKNPDDTIIDVKGERIGDGKSHYIMGPCAVENRSEERRVGKAWRSQWEHAD